MPELQVFCRDLLKFTLEKYWHGKITYFSTDIPVFEILVHRGEEYRYPRTKAAAEVPVVRTKVIEDGDSSFWLKALQLETGTSPHQNPRVSFSARFGKIRSSRNC